jgi:hypothetical protein
VKMNYYYYYFLFLFWPFYSLVVVGGNYEDKANTLSERLSIRIISTC